MLDKVAVDVTFIKPNVEFPVTVKEFKFTAPDEVINPKLLFPVTVKEFAFVKPNDVIELNVAFPVTVNEFNDKVVDFRF
jgi:hypothetical protein